MNIIEKLYCRIFQFCFKSIIPVLPYYNPKILNGIEDIPQILKEKNIKKIMLVTDKSIRSFGITTKLETLLSENQIELTIFDDVLVK